MKKEEIIDILRNYKNERASYYAIMTIGIFGSTARGDAREESDVDIVLRIREPDLYARRNKGRVDGKTSSSS